MADYYILDQENLKFFLPFLSPALRRGAEQGAFLVAGAVEDNLAVGAAAFSKAGSEARLESIAVSPEYQRYGIASGLLRYLRSVLPALDCFALKASLAPGQAKETAVKSLLESLGFQAVSGPTMISCPIAALRSSPLLQPLLHTEIQGVAPMKDVPKPRLREFGTALLQQGTTASPLDWEVFDPELSFFGLNERQEISCCVCTLQEENGISVEWLYTTPAGVKRLVLAVVALLRACEERFPPDALFSAVLVDDSARNLLEHLGGDAVTYTAAMQWRLDLLD
ncbi:GNAT family N-acetyltransferase [Oscillibacter valericigenes]|uniref:GNAT family N-acetyltransferase n=1 Tax=Oscillibacter valericigenes TaxID=351091 RepID=UPI001F276D3B|nr:GNAT family N-acetyltransferase [Oscillibacter valericigenes]MCF2615744.1 GNAT family N-acetyltransferase [Oscillibacter valericigenes]